MNKKKLIFLGLDVLVLVITIGVSLAVFNYVKKGENPNRVTAGAITMNFTEGVRNINLPVATPTSDEEGRSFGLEGSTCQNDSDNNVQCYTDFTISTNMSIDYSISYEVTLEKDEETTLNNNDVRIYLEKQDSEGNYKEVFTPKVYTEIDSNNLTETDELGANNSEMLLDSGEITKSTTYNYRLRIWLSSDYTFTNETKDFVGKINVYGSNVEINATGGITLSKTDLIIQKGDTKQITAIVKPDNAKNQNLIWESNDPSKVKVDSLGNITAIDITEAPVTITVYTKDKEHAAECIVTVVNYDAKGVTLNTKEVTLSKGNTYQLTSTITPTDAEDTRVTYTSSSDGIATITKDGLITAVGTGETTITVETINGYTDTCKVIVTEPNVTNISINGDDSVDVGSTIQLSTTIISDSIESSNVVWTSSDESKAIISSTGKVTGIAPGTITITSYIKEYPDIKATKNITIAIPDIKSITMSSDISINAGNSTTFAIWISPELVRNQNKIHWKSSNEIVTSGDLSNCEGKLTCTITGVSDGNNPSTSTITAVVLDDEGNETSMKASKTLTIKVSVMNLADYVKYLYDNGDTTLFYDETNDNNLRYAGANPNNYVNFNCNSDGTNCELWRIIGVMNNIKSSASSNSEIRVKLVKYTPIGNYSWDTYLSSYGINRWEDADLMKLLNPGYETNQDYVGNTGTKSLVNNSLYYNGGTGICYNGFSYSTTSCSFALQSNSSSDIYNRALGDNAKQFIGTTYWHTGGARSPGDIYAQYNSERGSVASASNGNLYWVGKVALVYPSDIIFAAHSCIVGKSVNSTGECWSDMWLSPTIGKHTLTTDTKESLRGNDTTSAISYNGLSDSRAVYPSVYLKSNVVVKQDGADGSYEKPYNIQLGT